MCRGKNCIQSTILHFSKQWRYTVDTAHAVLCRTIIIFFSPGTIILAEQDEPVREEHAHVSDRGEPGALHPGHAHHQEQGQPEGH